MALNYFVLNLALIGCGGLVATLGLVSVLLSASPGTTCQHCFPQLYRVWQGIRHFLPCYGNL